MQSGYDMHDQIQIFSFHSNSLPLTYHYLIETFIYISLLIVPIPHTDQKRASANKIEQWNW